MDLYKCDVCEMIFRDIGKLSGRKRIFHHKKTDHKASWLRFRRLGQGTEGLALLWRFYRKVPGLNRNERITIENTPTGASTNPKNFDLTMNLNRNLIWIKTWNLKHETETWNITSKLKLETKTWNWDMKLKLGIETWNWNLKLKLENETWNWNLKLKLEIKTWNWNLKLTLEIETWN